EPMLLAVVLLPLALQAPTPAAPKLVLRDGRTLTLSGPVRTKGRTATVKLADGTLLSVQVSEIDEQATAAANAPPTPIPVSTPAPRPTARVRYTSDDLPSRGTLSVA